MRFVRQNQYVLVFLGLLVFCTIMVLREIEARESAHVQRREDFLFIHEHAQPQAEQRLYQRLIQEFPDLSDRTLADDLQRTGMLVEAKKQEPDNLVWKFHVSLGNELRKRAERRVARGQQEGTQN